MGTGSASFGGGGVAHIQGPNAVFTNPAAISITDGFQVESGMMGFSSGLSPYFLFGSNAGEHNAYSLGYFFDDRVSPVKSGPARQGLVAGGSWDLDMKTSLGMAMHSVGTGLGVGLDGFGIDLDAGAMYRPTNLLWTGLAVHNLGESGVGQYPTGYEVRRSYLASMGLRKTGYQFLGILFHEPNFYYELRGNEIPPSGFGQAVSLASNFMPGGKLGLRATYIIPQKAQPGFALGMFLNIPAGMGSIVGGYTFDSGGGEDVFGEFSPSHSLSINIRWGAERDRFPPQVEIQADKLIVSQDSSGDRPVFFRLMAKDKTMVSEVGDGAATVGGGTPDSEGGLRNFGHKVMAGRISDWKLEVAAVETGGQIGAQVKLFQGRDLPPKMIRWDGVDGNGKLLSPGLYAFRLCAKDMVGNEGVTVWQMLELLSLGSVDGIKTKSTNSTSVDSLDLGESE